MRRRVVWGALLMISCFLFNGCSKSEGDQKPDEKIAGKPPVAVEAAKVSATDFTEGTGVVGSLSGKFGADVK